MIPKAACRRIVEKRGGTGTAAKLTPGPRTTHVPDRKVQGVC
jgi:hypothetical protein